MNRDEIPPHRRALKRYSVNLKVFEQETGDLIGYAEDLNVRGMKLQSLEPIREKKELHLWFGTTPDENPELRIQVTGFAVWNSFSDTAPRYYYSGIHFVDPSEAVMDRIETLIEAQE